MSFKRFDPEDIVLSSELITFPTWYTQDGGDTSHLDMVDAVISPEQGFSTNFYRDFYSAYTPPTCEGEEATSSFDAEHSKALFSVAYATRPESKSVDFTPIISYPVVEKEEYEDPTTGEISYHYVRDPKTKYYTQTEDPETGEIDYELVTFPIIKDGQPLVDENNVPILDEDETYYTKQIDYPAPIPSEIVFGQYRSLVLGDEDSEFRFGSTRVDNSDEEKSELYADSFIALSIDRARFREKLDPNTCQIHITTRGMTLAPDISANRRYLDAGRVFDLAELGEDGKFHYPKSDDTGSVASANTSYGYFLPDIGIILFNTSNNAELFGITDPSQSGYDSSSWSMQGDKINEFKSSILESIDLRSQETVTSNFVFARARNAEFNYSTNPSNITGSAGNLRHDIMINQPQSFITTVGLYNDANELLAVAKLSRPLIKDFTKEALIRIKLDY